MKEEINQPLPGSYRKMEQATRESGFTMASDILTCSLLRTLAATKPSGEFLELGTGTGLSTAWILDGMDPASKLLSIDHDPQVLKIAEQYLGRDPRLELKISDGGEWIEANRGRRFDYIFADSWHGKYLLLDEVLTMLKPSGLYIIDDMLPQPNWPEGHAEKALALMDYLDTRKDLFLTRQAWASGIIIAVKK